MVRCHGYLLVLINTLFWCFFNPRLLICLLYIQLLRIILSGPYGFYVFYYHTLLMLSQMDLYSLSDLIDACLLILFFD